MKKSRRSGRGTKADDNQKLTSGITRGDLGHRANKIARGTIVSTDVRGDSAAPTSNPRTLQMQPTAVVSMDTDRANGNLSQREKSDPDDIAKYVEAISGNWRRGVEAFLEIARLCAEAEERLDTAQQAELKANCRSVRPRLASLGRSASTHACANLRSSFCSLLPTPRSTPSLALTMRI
jgi:hypothetical protein